MGIGTALIQRGIEEKREKDALNRLLRNNKINNALTEFGVDASQVNSVSELQQVIDTQSKLEQLRPKSAEAGARISEAERETELAPLKTEEERAVSERRIQEAEEFKEQTPIRKEAEEAEARKKVLEVKKLEEITPSEIRVKKAQETPQEEREAQLETKKQEEKIKQESKRVQQLNDIRNNFNITANQFRQLVAQVKGKREEQGGLGLVRGMIGRLNVALKNKDFSRTASFPGQKRETALALNRVLTGQNRVIKGVLEMINETLPDDLDSSTFIANKTDQSLRNAYGIMKAFEKAGLTPDVLGDMSQEELDKLDVRSLVRTISFTPEEQEEIDDIISDVLATPASKPLDLIDEGEEVQSQTKTGVSFTYKLIEE